MSVWKTHLFPRLMADKIINAHADLEGLTDSECTDIGIEEECGYFQSILKDDYIGCEERQDLFCRGYDPKFVNELGGYVKLQDKDEYYYHGWRPHDERWDYLSKAGYDTKVWEEARDIAIQDGEIKSMKYLELSTLLQVSTFPPDEVVIRAIKNLSKFDATDAHMNSMVRRGLTLVIQTSLLPGVRDLASILLSERGSE